MLPMRKQVLFPVFLGMSVLCSVMSAMIAGCGASEPAPAVPAAVEIDWPDAAPLPPPAPPSTGHDRNDDDNDDEPPASTPEQ